MLNDKGNDKRLRKEEIIRGFESYSNVLRNSTPIQSQILKAFLNQEKDRLSSVNIKAGFIVSKKKIRSAVQRNRIKRLLKESYRLNKSLLEIPRGKSYKLIFSLNDSGYDLFTGDKKTKISLIENDMKILIEKINNYTKEK